MLLSSWYYECRPEYLALPRLQSEYQFSIDGRRENLVWVEEKILEDSNGDVRALFATSRAAMGTPRLMSEPLRASVLESQLQQATQKALNSHHLLRIDHDDQAICVWQLILRRYAALYDRIDRVSAVLSGAGLRKGDAMLALLPNVSEAVECELAALQQRRRLEGVIEYDLRENFFDRRLNDVLIATKRRAIP